MVKWLIQGHLAATLETALESGILDSLPCAKLLLISPVSLILSCKMTGTFPLKHELILLG